MVISFFICGYGSDVKRSHNIKPFCIVFYSKCDGSQYLAAYCMFVWSLYPVQSWMFLSQYRSLLPLLRRPSIILFNMGCINLYFSVLIRCPKYAIILLLTVFSSCLSIFICLITSWFVMWENFKFRRYIHISNVSIFFSSALLMVQVSS